MAPKVREDARHQPPASSVRGPGGLGDPGLLHLPGNLSSRAHRLPGYLAGRLRAEPSIQQSVGGSGHQRRTRYAVMNGLVHIRS